MHRYNSLCCLDFNNQLLPDYDINPITAIEAYVLVDDRERHLAAMLDTGLIEFETQTFFVSRFEKPWPEMAMHIDRQSDYPLCQIPMSDPDRQTRSLFLSVSSVSPW